jgi:predicted TIM-barrel fold metal-dependent hydrolase
MFGTNWPLGRLFGRYHDVVDAYRAIIDGYSADERGRMLAGTARDIYALTDREAEHQASPSPRSTRDTHE